MCISQYDLENLRQQPISPDLLRVLTLNCLDRGRGQLKLEIFVVFMVIRISYNRCLC